MSVFVDTSAFYAAADAGDRSHARAMEVLRDADALVTSDHVLAAALPQGVGVERETSDVYEAYARFPSPRPARYRQGFLSGD